MNHCAHMVDFYLQEAIYFTKPKWRPNWKQWVAMPFTLMWAIDMAKEYAEAMTGAPRERTDS